MKKRLSQRHKWAIRWYTAYNDVPFNDKLIRRVPLTFPEKLHHQALMECIEPLDKSIDIIVDLPHTFLENRLHIGDSAVCHSWISGWLSPPSTSRPYHVVRVPKASHIVAADGYGSFPTSPVLILAPGTLTYKGLTDEVGVAPVHDWSYRPRQFLDIPYLPLTADDLEEIQPAMKYNLAYMVKAYNIPMSRENVFTSILWFFRKESPLDVVAHPDFIDRSVSERKWSHCQFYEKAGILFLTYKKNKK